MTKQLHLGAFMRPVSIHTAWWRYPGAFPDANFNLKRGQIGTSQVEPFTESLPVSHLSG